MGIKKLTSGCTNCGDEEPIVRTDCTVQLDTSCIFYRWKDPDEIALSCLGLTSGTDLSTILETIDSKLCEFSGYNLSGYDLGCLGEDYDIYSLQDFAEAISKEVCQLKSEDFGFKLDTLNAYIGLINKPALNDTCIGYVQGDTVQQILQKIFDKVCDIESKKNKVVSSPDIQTLPSKTVELIACDEKNHTLKAEVKVSNVAGNQLKVFETGLYVPSLSDADIGALLDRINSVPVLKEKLCNICSFNQGVGGSSNNNARTCQCTMSIASVTRYNGNKYSAIINTVNLGIAPYYWEVRNNLNAIVSSGTTSSESNYLETFDIPNSLVSGAYTVRYTSTTCDCTDIISFNHVSGVPSTVSPIIINAIQNCVDNVAYIIVSSLSGSNPQVTTIVRNAANQVIHTRTNNLSYNEYEINVNGAYTVTVYDSDNSLVSSIPFPVNVTCIGEIEPPTDICVTYNILNLTEDPITLLYTDCDEIPTSAIIDPETNAILCMIRDSYVNNDDLSFTEINEGCEAVCSIEILSATIECN
jgi:hypothetical protein